MNEREKEFADAAQVLRESVLIRAADATLCRATLLGSRSGSVSVFAAASAALKGPLDTVRGVAAAIACVITHAILLQFLPDRLAPVKPLAYGMVVAFAAFVAVAGLFTTRNNTTAIADSSAGTANTRNS